MANLDVLTYGFSFVSDQGLFGWSTVSLVTMGETRILVDTGPASRKPLVFKALQAKGLEPADIDVVILAHLHWDHSQNADMFSNARIVVNARELDYARRPNPADLHMAKPVADMVAKMKVNPVDDGDRIMDGLSVISTPGHTKGHMSVIAELDGERVLVAGDAMPDGGTLKRGIPYNVFWDVSDARDSVQKIRSSSDVFCPGHDRPFRLENNEVKYLHGPTKVEVWTSNEGGAPSSLTYTVHAVRPANIDIVQK
ncbi:MAG: N-acyl homoserine lactonase family protein [SAR202 cluster bacterium]|nr:N-acyl homoserine lactonase family protein [SAR202 cluster bacterium]